MFAGGYAFDTDGWQWGVVRKGTTEGFDPSDEFIRGDDGTSYRTAVSSILADKQGNVWVAYQSRPATSWATKWATIKKLACAMSR